MEKSLTILRQYGVLARLVKRSQILSQIRSGQVRSGQVRLGQVIDQVIDLVLDIILQ